MPSTVPPDIKNALPDTNNTEIISYPVPKDEAKRLALLKQYDIMHSQQEPAFERITDLVKQFLGFPFVAITFLDENDQFFKSIIGSSLKTTPRHLALCNYTISEMVTFVVPDTTEHPELRSNPMVVGEPFLRFYAGVPLLVDNEAGEKFALGALCVMDSVPHHDFDAAKMAVLAQFAAMVVDALQLRQQQYLAKRSSKIKSAFIANMSHEIRTPMNGIMGMLDLLAQTPLDAQQSEYVGHVKSSCEHLMVLMNDILDLSKVESGQMRFDYVEVDLSELCQNVMTTFAPKALEKHIEFTLDYPPSLQRHANTDPVRVFQILSNLVNNAIKFTPSFGKVTLQARDNRLNLDCNSPCNLVIEVIDTGIGIHPDSLAVIFDAYNQADKFTHRLYGGTGLGLSVCKALAEHMGGTITVESKQGHGSTFRLCLPLNKVNQVSIERNAPPSTQPPPSPISRLPAHILLVEDDKVTAMIAQKNLVKFGYEVTWVKDGKEAVDTFSRSPQRFDVILMDHQMPIMNGVEATKVLKLLFTDLPPIIAVTAHAMYGDKNVYLNAGMQDYCTKPYKPAELDSMIQKWLQTNVKNR